MRVLPAETNRLMFRQLNPEDVQNLMTIFGDAETMRYYPSTKTVQEAKEWIDKTIQSYAELGHGFWAVCLKGTGEFLGQCGIIRQKLRGYPEMEIGYLFQRRVWGYGYATEAAAACRDCAFERLRVQQVVSYIDPLNARSIKVAQRIGMTLVELIPAEKCLWHKTIAVYSKGSALS